MEWMWDPSYLLPYVLCSVRCFLEGNGMWEKDLKYVGGSLGTRKELFQKIQVYHGQQHPVNWSFHSGSAMVISDTNEEEVDPVWLSVCRQ